MTWRTELKVDVHQRCGAIYHQAGRTHLLQAIDLTTAIKSDLLQMNDYQAALEESSITGMLDVRGVDFLSLLMVASARL